MAKKVTTITHSDGTKETVVEQKKGVGHALWVSLGAAFVIAMVIKTWWLGIVIGALVVIAIIGGFVERSKK